VGGVAGHFGLIGAGIGCWIGHHRARQCATRITITTGTKSHSITTGTKSHSRGASDGATRIAAYLFPVRRLATVVIVFIRRHLFGALRFARL
jgi:hypothetical protein